MENSKSRAFNFTINNYTEEDIEYLRSEVASKAVYVIWGKEVGPKCGTPHLQGFASFKSPMTRSAASKVLKGHLTAILVDNGCAKYCTKDGKYEEHGVRPKTRKESAALGGAAKKEKHAVCRDLAIAGDLETIAKEHPDVWLRSYRTLKEIKKDHMPPVPSVPVLENEWICGPTGSGKTSGVLARYPDAYLKTCNKWWDGYQGEETVLIDDIDETHKCLVHHLKIWGDHKPFLAETKGGFLKIRPKRIICTSNCPIYALAQGNHLLALERRYKVTDQYPISSEPIEDFHPMFKKRKRE